MADVNDGRILCKLFQSFYFAILLLFFFELPRSKKCIGLDVFDQTTTVNNNPKTRTLNLKSKFPRENTATTFKL